MGDIRKAELARGRAAARTFAERAKRDAWSDYTATPYCRENLVDLVTAVLRLAGPDRAAVLRMAGGHSPIPAVPSLAVRDWMAADPGPFLPDRKPSKVNTTKPLTNVREIAPGLYVGRVKEGPEAGRLCLFDDDYHRGYVTQWATAKMPDGWRVHCWGGPRGRREPIAPELRRTYPTLLAAERALVREGVKLNGATA